MLLQDELLIIVLQSNNVYDISCKYYKETLEEINEQFLNCLNDTPKSIKIDISFQEALLLLLVLIMLIQNKIVNCGTLLLMLFLMLKFHY